MTKMSKMAKTVFFQKFTKNLRKIVKKPEISEKNLKNIDTTSEINYIIYQKGSKPGYLLFTGHQKYSRNIQEFSEYSKKSQKYL